MAKLHRILQVCLLAAATALNAAGTPKVLQDDLSGFIFEDDFNAPEARDLSLQSGRFTRIDMRETRRSSEPGKPDLPMRAYLIGIPPGDYRVRFMAEEQAAPAGANIDTRMKQP